MSVFLEGDYMKKYINGKYIDLTADEIAALEADLRRASLMERSRALTAEEVSRMLIAAQINTLAVDDNTALRMLEFYPEWSADTAYESGYKVRFGQKLYRCVIGHTSQADWSPDVAATLWEVIDETHAGTMEDPIPYDGNMELEQGKYYMQNYEIYLCNRDTINPVYQSLRELVGIYTEEV